MQSISLPGLVLWLPLGSPAACLKHAQVPVARSQNVDIINSLHGIVVQPITHGLRTSQSAPHCAHIADAVAYRGPSESPRPSLLLFPIPSLTPADIPPSNAPATGMGGATGNPQSSSGRFIASYNLCSFLLHCHAPSHSYTGVVFSLCLELLLPVNAAALWKRSIFRAKYQVLMRFPSLWCLGAIFSTEFHTHLVASVLVYLAVVVNVCSNVSLCSHFDLFLYFT